MSNKWGIESYVHIFNATQELKIREMSATEIWMKTVYTLLVTELRTEIVALWFQLCYYCHIQRNRAL